MNSKKLLFSLLALVLITLPLVAYGQGGGKDTLEGLVNGLRDNLTKLGGGLATIAFIVAGFMFLTATGKPERMQIGKQSLLAAVIGIIVILLAPAAESFIQTLFDIT